MKRTTNSSKKYDSFICRSCINKLYRVKLQRENCDYFPYPNICPECGQMKNIVSGFRLSGKLKMLTARKHVEDKQ